MSFSSGSLPPVDPSVSASTSVAPTTAAPVPASIRDGNGAAKQAYATALGFEKMLVDQLTQQLAATATGSDGSHGDGSGQDGASGLMGSDPASSMYSQLLPNALTSGLMSSGGTGMALALAKALDPAIGTVPVAAAAAAATAAAAQPTATASGAAGSTAATSTGGAAVGTTQPTGTGSTADSTAATSTGGAALGVTQSVGASQATGGTHSTDSEGSEGAGQSGEKED